MASHSRAFTTRAAFLGLSLSPRKTKHLIEIIDDNLVKAMRKYYKEVYEIAVAKCFPMR